MSDQILSLEKTIGELTGEVSKIDTAKLRTYKHITINIKTVDNFPLLETFIPLLVISTIKDPISISISLTIIPIKK